LPPKSLRPTSRHILYISITRGFFRFRWWCCCCCYHRDASKKAQWPPRESSFVGRCGGIPALLVLYALFFFVHMMSRFIIYIIEYICSSSREVYAYYSVGRRPVLISSGKKITKTNCLLLHGAYIGPEISFYGSPLPISHHILYDKHTHTHTHIYIYIYINVYVCVSTRASRL